MWASMYGRTPCYCSVCGCTCAGFMEGSTAREMGTQPAPLIGRTTWPCSDSVYNMGTYRAERYGLLALENYV